MNQIEELNKACSMAEKAGLGLMKSHVKQYTRADGTMVQEHEDSRQAAQQASFHANTSGDSKHHHAAAEAHRKAASDAQAQAEHHWKNRDGEKSVRAMHDRDMHNLEADKHSILEHLRSDYGLKVHSQKYIDEFHKDSAPQGKNKKESDKLEQHHKDKADEHRKKRDDAWEQGDAATSMTHNKMADLHDIEAKKHSKRAAMQQSGFKL